MRIYGISKKLESAIAKLLLAIIILSVLFSFNLPSVTEIINLPESIVMSQNELNNLNIKYVKVEKIQEQHEISSDIKAAAQNVDFQSYENGHVTQKLRFKLFNLIPLKTVNVKIEAERKAYLGGFAVGLSIKSNGVIVVSRAEIETFAGYVMPNSQAQAGDIITEFNGKKVLYCSEIVEQMQALSAKDKVVELKVMRNNQETKVFSYPVIEEFTGHLKLGLAVKDSIDGVGTVSYVKEDGRFGCLGHPISDGSSGVIDCFNGQVYSCKILGFNKSTRGTPGELKGAFINTQNPIGTVEKNNNFGVYGKLDKKISSQLYDIGSRFSVKNGKAQILTTIADTPAFYDIEIIKTTSQNTPNEKGMIIRVTDKNLLADTGGILQGMSGSPIIQDGKLVGVVTHVLISDPTKGYAIYLDFMYDN